MLPILCVLTCLTPQLQQSDTSKLDTIEYTFRQNELLKAGKIFKYRFYKSGSCKDDYSVNFQNSDYQDDVYVDLENMVYYKSISNVDSGAKKTIPHYSLFCSTLVIYDKLTLMEYSRLPIFEHAELRKRPAPSISYSPYNYGVLGQDVLYTVDSLIRRSREGKYECRIHSIADGKTKCSFKSKDASLYFEFVLLNDKKYTIESIAITDNVLDMEMNTTRMLFSDYAQTQDGLYYAKKCFMQLIQNRKIVQCGVCIVSSVTPFTEDPNILTDDLPPGTSIAIENLKFSNTMLEPQSVSINDFSRLIKLCEATSVSKQSPKTNANRLAYSITAILVILLMLFALWKYFQVRAKNVPSIKSAGA